MNGVENESIFCDFDSLDLESVHEDLSEEITGLAAIHSFLINKYCELPYEEFKSDLAIFLKTEIDTVSKELKRLSSVRSSLRKIRYWKVIKAE